MPQSLPNLLLTAGPTHEPIDAVRYLGNRSSGRLGLALAAAAARRGHRVTLLLGPTILQPPVQQSLKVHRFQTANELERLLADTWPSHDVLIMAAAVADFRPSRPAQDGKLRRSEGGHSLDLEPVPDLLAGLSAITRPDQIVIGFALEPEEEMLDSARAKLARKRLDAIVANPLATMDSDTIRGTLLLKDGRVLRPKAELSKPAFAEWLLDRLPGPSHVMGDEKESPTKAAK